MIGLTRIRMVLLVLAGWLAAVPVDAQIRAEDPEAIAATVRQELWEPFVGSRLLEILRQSDESYSREALDVLADSLVEIALDLARSDDRADHERAEGIMRLLTMAAWPSEEYEPYAGSAERLARLANTLTEPKWGGTIYLLTGVANREEALVHIREFTISTNPHAYMGVEMLARYTGPEGLEVLRQLYQADLVVEPRAKRKVEGLAEYYDWH